MNICLLMLLVSVFQAGATPGATISGDFSGMTATVVACDLASAFHVQVALLESLRGTIVKVVLSDDTERPAVHKLADALFAEARRTRSGWRLTPRPADGLSFLDERHAFDGKGAISLKDARDRLVDLFGQEFEFSPSLKQPAVCFAFDDLTGAEAAKCLAAMLGADCKKTDDGWRFEPKVHDTSCLKAKRELKSYVEGLLSAFGSDKELAKRLADFSQKLESDPWAWSDDLSFLSSTTVETTTTDQRGRTEYRVTVTDPDSTRKHAWWFAVSKPRRAK